jgi:hypothetical protein
MLEIALVVQQVDVPVWATRLQFWAFTLGHVIVGQSRGAMAVLRSHEWVHVRLLSTPLPLPRCP